MKINKSFAKLSLLASATAQLSMTTNVATAADWQQIDKKNQILNNEAIDLSKFIDSGRTVINDDAGVIETRLTAQEAATSPMSKLTKDEPIVMGVFDGANDMGTIQIINMKRHPDGSATLYQKFFTPYEFERQADGGQLNDTEYGIIKDRYGYNPFRKFKTNETKYKNAFVSIEPIGLQTAMGLAMQRYGASYGMFAFLEPQVRSWTTTSGNAFRKKVTFHVEAHFKPHWYFLTPSDVGSDFGNISKPFYILENKKSVISGVNLHQVEENTANINAERVKVFYDKKSKSGWTGFAMVAVGIALGAMTGGLGFAAYGALGTGAIGGMAVAGYAFVNGNDNLANVVSSDLAKLDAVSDEKSLNVEKKWTMKWKNVMRDDVNAGPLDGNLKNITNEFQKEKDDWEKLTVSPR